MMKYCIVIRKDIDDLIEILLTSPLFGLDSITVRDFKDERLSSNNYIFR